jgi:Ca2+-binding RTX toxin-like protein
LHVVDSNVQFLKLVGMGPDNDYVLNSSAVPLTIVNASNEGTLDFSHDAAGVAVNLGLDRGQAQTMAGWNTTLAINGVLNEIIGSPYADTLVGGPAALTIIHSGAGNDTIVGGSGNNILVGGGGNDTIVGGSGRDLLIAGSGASTIYADGSSNMVFAGTTNFDANDQALLNLLNQGPNFIYSYAMRQAMAAAARNPALRASLLTFQDSGARDTIFGSGLNNWFEMGRKSVLMR